MLHFLIILHIFSTVKILNIFAVTPDLDEIIYDQFYQPTEVLGEPGVTAVTREKLNVCDAIYGYQPAP